MDYRLRYPDLKCKVRERQYAKAQAKLEKADNALAKAEAQYSKINGRLIDKALRDANTAHKLARKGN